MIEYKTLEEARIAHPHTMFKGAYYCPTVWLPHMVFQSVRYSVVLRTDGTYGCPTCDEPVTIPTCGKEGE